MITLIISVILVSFLFFVLRSDKRKTFYQIHKQSMFTIFICGSFLTVLINVLFFIVFKDELKTDYRLEKMAYIQPSNLDSIKLVDGYYKVYLKDKIMYGSLETDEIEIPENKITFSKTGKPNNELYKFNEFFLPLWDKECLIFSDFFAPKRVFYKLFLNEENCKKFKECFR